MARPKKQPLTPERIEQIRAEALAHEGGPQYPGYSSIHLYTGDRGQGKSLSAVADAAVGYEAGIPVYHTGGVFFGEELDADALRANTYQRCIIIIDELEEYLNNLRTGATFQVDLIGMLIQLRHQDCQLLATTQYPSEINGRFLRRVDAHYLCESRDDGRTVRQFIRSHPWNPDSRTHGKTRIRVLTNATFFHQLYHSKRFVAVGEHRASASELRARAQIRQTEAIWGYVISASLTGRGRLSATEIQYHLAAQQPAMHLTVQKIGRALADFQAYGLTLLQVTGSSRRKEWVIPEGLGMAYEAENPEEAARVRGEPAA